MPGTSLPLALSCAALLLAGCSTTSFPNGRADRALPADSPYAGSRQYPWTDRLEPAVADPYGAGRSYPWSSPTAAPALGAQGLNSGRTFVSDLPWTSARNGWGPVERDRSNGEQGAADGRALKIGGRTFAKGLGVHASSDVRYALGGQCTSFTAFVGRDAEVGPRGSVIFEVYGDGRMLYSSAGKTGVDGILLVDVNTTDVRELRLVVSDGGDNIHYDHADWGDAAVNCVAEQPSGEVALSDLPYTSATNGWGPVEFDRSNGEQAQFDGRPLTIGGQVFVRGLGVHASAGAASTLTYNLGGGCSAFAASLGIDDEVGNRGSVAFQVFGDGQRLYDSGVLRGSDAASVASVAVSGVKVLKLVVTDGGDGIDYDHADWAGATLKGCGAAPPPPPAPAPLVWTARAPAPTTLYEGQGAAVGGKLYVFGGFDKNVNNRPIATRAASVYDLAADRWIRLRDIPDPVTHAGVAADAQSIYLAGGFLGDHPGPQTSHVWRYDVAGDTWSALPPLPMARGAGALVRLGRVLHYFGGVDRDASNRYRRDYGDHWTLNLDGAGPSVPGTWQAAAPMPNPRNHLAGAAIGGLIYAIGGQHLGDEANGNQREVDVYDPATNAWRVLSPLPIPLGHITSSVFGWRGQIIVAGGVTVGERESAQVFAYDPAADRWSTLAALPGPRQSPVADMIGDALVVATGATAAGPTTSTFMGR